MGSTLHVTHRTPVVLLVWKSVDVTITAYTAAPNTCPLFCVTFSKTGKTPGRALWASDMCNRTHLHHLALWTSEYARRPATCSRPFFARTLEENISGHYYCDRKGIDPCTPPAPRQRKSHTTTRSHALPAHCADHPACQPRFAANASVLLGTDSSVGRSTKL